MTRLQHLTSCVLLFAVVILSGCGVKPVTGGTRGTLSSSGNPLSDVQITLFRNDKGELYSFGSGQYSRWRQLVTNGAMGPLDLEPGEYSCTLESVGAPIVIPEEYLRSDTTPLKLDWKNEETLKLEIFGVRAE
jgi:hypothetical protein